MKLRGDFQTCKKDQNVEHSTQSKQKRSCAKTSGFGDEDSIKNQRQTFDILETSW